MTELEKVGMDGDDYHLCEGLLNIFIKKNDERHVITFKKNNIMRSSASSLSTRPRADAMIDFGSYKETISVDPSEFGGLGGATSANRSGAGGNTASFQHKSIDSAMSGSIQTSNCKRSADTIAQPYSPSPVEKGHYDGTSGESSDYSKFYY